MAKSIRVEHDGKIIVVKKPGHKEHTEANLYAAGVFNKAIQSKAIVRPKLEEYLVKNEIWSTEHKKLVEDIRERLSKNVHILETKRKEDGTQLKLSEAKKLSAIDIPNDRRQLLLMETLKRQYDPLTAEALSDEARFDALCSLCMYTEEGDKLFESIDDYGLRADDEHISMAASKLADLTYGTVDWQKELPENQFLLKYKFIDEDLRFIDKDGNHITYGGTKVDEEGKLLDEKKEEVFDDFEHDI